VLAPDAPLRTAVTAFGHDTTTSRQRRRGLPPVPARAPPARDGLAEPLSDRDALAQPAPEIEFDQRISW
jgi:hypothetical protein